MRWLHWMKECETINRLWSVPFLKELLHEADWDLLLWFAPIAAKSALYIHSRLAIVEFLTLTLSLDMTGLGRYFLNWFNQIPDMHFLWTSGTISTDNLRPRCCFSSLLSSSSTSPPPRGSPMPRSSPSRTMSRISAGEGCPLISKCGANLDSTLLQNMFPVCAQVASLNDCSQACHRILPPHHRWRL